MKIKLCIKDPDDELERYRKKVKEDNWIDLINK